MNYTEANEILSELKAFFPDWTVWVRTLDNRDATLRVWIKSLMTQDKQHVLDIIDEYASGKRKAPTSYEYERLIFTIVAAARESAMKESEKESYRTELRTYREEQEAAKRRRAEYKPLQDRSMKQAASEYAMAVDQVISETGRPRSQWTPEDKARYDDLAGQVYDRFFLREAR